MLKIEVRNVGFKLHFSALGQPFYRNYESFINTIKTDKQFQNLTHIVFSRIFSTEPQED